jgi:hypothetical protein
VVRSGTQCKRHGPTTAWRFGFETSSKECELLESFNLAKAHLKQTPEKPANVLRNTD